MPNVKLPPFNSTHYKNQRDLFNQAPLLKVDPKSPNSSVNWLLSKTYINFQKSDMSDKMAKLYNSMLSNNKLAILVKVLALNSVSRTLSIGLVDEMKNYYQFHTDIGITQYYSILPDIGVYATRCDLDDMSLCKKILSHEFGHAITRIIFRSSEVTPYPCSPTGCDQTKQNKFRAAAFETLKNLANAPILGLTNAQKLKAAEITDYNELGKFVDEACGAPKSWRTQICTITDGFLDRYAGVQIDSEMIANYIEIQSLAPEYYESRSIRYLVEMLAIYLGLPLQSQINSENVTTVANTILKPLDDYWEQEIEPLIEKYISTHPHKDLVI